jgi:hypothetical protein
MRYTASVAAWSLFWTLAVIGVALLILEWHAIQALAGL